METHWIQFTTSSAVAILLAVFSAHLTVQFALKRFYTEKKWERKADTYANLLEALHQMKNYSEIHMKHEIRGIEPPEDQQRELAATFQRAHAEVLKRADVGTFAMSEEAVSAIRRLEKDLAESQNMHGWWAHLQLEHDAVEKCLASVQQIAKKDLGYQN